MKIDHCVPKSVFHAFGSLKEKDTNIKYLVYLVDLNFLTLVTLRSIILMN